MTKNLLLCFWLFLPVYLISAQTSLSYTESNDIFANPERGLQKYSITNASYNNTTNYTNLSQSTLEGWRTGDDKVTVIFRYFLLSNFLESNISQTYLNNIQQDFNVIRNAGLKCIVRFSYSNSQSSSPQQPVKSRILAHINQLATLLEANKDIIYTHQAGFLGTWGEWYYTNSDEFGTAGSINTTQWANRKEIIDAMLDATPVEIPVQVRYPRIKYTMYGSTQLTPSTAYQHTAIARIGFYNDAFLNTWGDQGTYSGVGQNENPVGSADYVYLSNETKYTPMTGETNGLNAPRKNGDNAVTEMNATNWSTLNKDYYAQNITNWINSGHFPEMLRRLGYRFVLQNGTYHVNGTSLSVSIDIKNVGFSRLTKPRNATLELRNTSDNNLYSFTLNSDPRTWEGEITVSQLIDISSIPNGNYAAYLKLADPDTTLATRSEYSIRFANSNVWNSQHGYNDLNYTFDKTSDSPPSGGNCQSVTINIDGNSDEWSTIAVHAQYGGEVFKIHNDDDYVYFMFDGNTFVNYQIYIDTNDGASGYTAHSWSSLAADLRIENGGLREYTGSGTDWSWNNLGSLTAVKDNGIVEVRLDRSYITGNSLKAGFRTLNSSWVVLTYLPGQNDITEYVLCITCPQIELDIDGDIGEWSAVPVFSQAGEEVLKIYDNQDYIAFMFSGNNFTNYQIYIDTNDGASGYTAHSWSNLAADLRIENGGLREYTGSGTDWSWNSLGSLTAVKDNGIVEVQLSKSYFTNNSFKGGFRTLNSSWTVVTALPGQNDNTEYSICNDIISGGEFIKSGSIRNTGNFEKKLKIYPNPVGNTLNINHNLSDDIININIYCVDGVLLKRLTPGDIQAETYQMDVSGLSAGSYILTMITKQNNKTAIFFKR